LIEQWEQETVSNMNAQANSAGNIMSSQLAQQNNTQPIESRWTVLPTNQQ
jgi:hypothetical protein